VTEGQQAELTLDGLVGLGADAVAAELAELDLAGARSA